MLCDKRRGYPPHDERGGRGGKRGEKFQERKIQYRSSLRKTKNHSGDCSEEGEGDWVEKIEEDREEIQQGIGGNHKIGRTGEEERKSEREVDSGRGEENGQNEENRDYRKNGENGERSRSEGRG